MIKTIRDDRVVRVAITAKHLAIVKDNTKIDHTTQHLNNNKPLPILHPSPHLWKLLFTLKRRNPTSIPNAKNGILSNVSNLFDICLTNNASSLNNNDIQKNKEVESTRMPSYVKFLKDILTKKRKNQYFETVALTQATSDIFKNGVPEKITVLGSFIVPCLISSVDLGRALCDLGFPSDAENYNAIESLMWIIAKKKYLPNCSALKNFMKMKILKTPWNKREEVIDYVEMALEGNRMDPGGHSRNKLILLHAKDQVGRRIRGHYSVLKAIKLRDERSSKEGNYQMA
ncbi:uncharacterized protein E6C27_scaffold34G002110 [Cucumis melo var. makuwa]|uniref:Uncharacterized protein n=1 Tax=Cucumis melo var. makuwa TaxID=1194695 RepID=A0A5A7SJE0_CUCMM|nr:uncharacterized protein E6C27_scaffold34G002110 [Cucumis melo var. makuwa]